MAKLKLPKHLFITREEDGGDHYFCAYETLEEAASADEAVVVGTYEFKGVHKVVLRAEATPCSV